jgi:hypothetical protein
MLDSISPQWPPHPLTHTAHEYEGSAHFRIWKTEKILYMLLISGISLHTKMQIYVFFTISLCPNVPLGQAVDKHGASWREPLL